MFKKVIIVICLGLISSTHCKTEPEIARAQSFTLKRGKTRTITLAANPTTGYSWHLAEPLEEDSPIEIEDSGYKQSSPGRIGQGGSQFWIIKAKNPGPATIIFEYKKRWETDVPAVKTQTFTFHVR